jgi:hypothetical protein
MLPSLAPSLPAVFIAPAALLHKRRTTVRFALASHDGSAQGGWSTPARHDAAHEKDLGKGAVGIFSE